MAASAPVRHSPQRLTLEVSRNSPAARPGEPRGADGPALDKPGALAQPLGYGSHWKFTGPGGSYRLTAANIV